MALPVAGEEGGGRGRAGTMKMAWPDSKTAGPGDRLMLAWVIAMTVTSVWLSFSHTEAAILRTPFIGDLQRIVPSIRKLCAISPSPTHTAALFSLMWVAAPLLVAAMVQQRNLLFPQRPQSRLPMLVVASVPLCALFFCMAFFLPGFDTGDLHVRRLWIDLLTPLVRSRIGSGVFGGLVIFFVAYAAVACFTFTSRMLTGRK